MASGKQSKGKRLRKVPAWKAFEQAVARFVRAIDPKATVIENAKLPDVDTGHPRQRDVIIEAKACNLYPIRILISCKLKKRRLSEEDIDHFVGEIRSASAHLGVIYANGYSGPAIEKARKLKIECCSLLRREPPQLPGQLFLTWYVCRPQIGIRISKPIHAEWRVKTVSDVLDLRATCDGHQTTFSTVLGAAAEKAHRQSIKDGMPDAWSEGMTISSDDNPGRPPVSISVMGRWRYFQARVEGHLLDGSYSFTQGSFVGQQSSPVIDTWGPHPGEGWEELPERPTCVSPRMVFCFFNSAQQLADQLREFFGNAVIE